MGEQRADLKCAFVEACHDRRRSVCRNAVTGDDQGGESSGNASMVIGEVDDSRGKCILSVAYEGPVDANGGQFVTKRLIQLSNPG